MPGVARRPGSRQLPRVLEWQRRQHGTPETGFNGSGNGGNGGIGVNTGPLLPGTTINRGIG